MLRSRNYLLPRNYLLLCAAVLSACAPNRLQHSPEPAVAAPGAPEPLALESASPWRPLTADTGRITDLSGLQALAADFPESASVQRRLLSAAANANDQALVRATLERLEAMGYSLRPQVFDALAEIIGAADAATARARAAAVAAPVGESRVFATVPAEHKLVEGVAWDQATRRLFVSSFVDRQLLLMSGGRGVPVEGLQAGSLSGLAVDEQRRLLWAGSGVLEQTPNPEAAFRGLIGVDLDALTVRRRVPAPADGSPSDVGLGPDGTVYASDSMRGALYRLRPGADQMDVLVPPGTLRSPQGIAIHPSGRWMYVADFAYGIAIVDTVSGAVSRLRSARPMMLDGIDGLLWYRGELVGIQNSTSPRRIVRIAISPGGRVATGLQVIEANHPDWGAEPTLGQIVGDHLIYVSDPQWERFGPGGALKGPEALRPNRIRITPLTDVPSPPPVP